jgi:hypothetical protein
VLSRFAREAVTVGEEGDLRRRISDQGHDELTVVAASVNTMLATLQVSRQQRREDETLREDESRYRHLVNLSPNAASRPSAGITRRIMTR